MDAIRRTGRWRRAVILLGLVVVLLVAAAYGTREPTLPFQVSRDHRGFENGTLFLHVTTRDPDRVREFSVIAGFASTRRSPTFPRGDTGSREDGPTRSAGAPPPPWPTARNPAG